MGKDIFKRRGRKWKIYTILCAVLLVAAVRGSFIRFTDIRPVFGGPIYKGDKESNSVAIAVNVDWGEEYLPDMLKLFDAAGIKAAFFMTGRWAEKNTALAKLIADSGHTVGNHGYSHKDHSKLDYDQNRSEIEITQQVLERVTGKTPGYFAPPSGAYNKHTVKASKDLGCKMVLWSIDTIDWKREGVDRIISRVKKKLHSGGIILMHPTDQTLEALPFIIEYINERGYEILSLEDLVKTIEN
ncbi:MAG TPA: polysaccharide deacetylase family protein [Bacillota bacterium]|jgi:probable sporulation protein (polysaccharide deacetylase family)|nr:polysaccharide deacetylase family protein [Bacillota bacterium]